MITMIKIINVQVVMLMNKMKIKTSLVINKMTYKVNRNNRNVKITKEINRNR